MAPHLIERADGTLVADARTPIETLEERQGIRLRPAGDQEEVDTLGGLVSTLAGRVPKRGEVIAHPSGIEFEVLEGDPRRIKRLRVRSLPAANGGAGRRQCVRSALFRVQPGSRVDTPLCRLADGLAGAFRVAALRARLCAGGRRCSGIAAVRSDAATGGRVPGLLWLDDGSAGPGASFRLGWVFGFGFFLAGLYWIAAALFVDIDRFWWLVPFAAAGLPAGFALYIGLALLATRLVRDYLHLPAIGADIRLCHRLECGRMGPRPRLDRAAVEFDRLCLVGRFSGGPRGAAERCLGRHLRAQFCDRSRSLAAWPLLGEPSMAPMSAARRWTPAISAGLLILVPAVAGAIRLETMPTVLTGTWLRLVQPSIPQSLKWYAGGSPGQFPTAARFERRAGRPSARRGAVAGGGSAVSARPRRGRPPGNRDDRPARRLSDHRRVAGKPAAGVRSKKCGTASRRSTIAATSSRITTRRTWSRSANTSRCAAWLPFKKITAGTMDLSAGPGPRTIALPGLPPFAALICYEAIFPGAIVDESDRPAWMLNVTNDAWYGRSSGPYQHFAIARTRAVEEGLPLVRVANNGISAVIDAAGRVLARTRLDAVGYVDAALAGPGGAHALRSGRRLDVVGAASARRGAGGDARYVEPRYTALRLQRLISG